MTILFASFCRVNTEILCYLVLYATFDELSSVVSHNINTAPTFQEEKSKFVSFCQSTAEKKPEVRWIEEYAG